MILAFVASFPKDGLDAEHGGDALGFHSRVRQIASWVAHYECALTTRGTSADPWQDSECGQRHDQWACVIDPTSPEHTCKGQSPWH